ncbi:aldehyde dehydrogenase family protein [Haloferula sargassicola]|uniref:Aldehyde dehydrogenase n=1 Tax=Haloferula sargassicola TaxID=490096 RepID=A0ABP9UTG3_9BACT
MSGDFNLGNPPPADLRLTAASRDAYVRVHDGFARGVGREPASRRAALERLLKVLEEREDAILEALDADLGKPGLEAWLAEYHFVREDLRLAIRKLDSWVKPQQVGSPFFVQPARSWIQREPHGAVLIMAPWNYPIQLSLSPLIAAVAGGNTVVLKPSEHAPASARLLAEMVAASFDPSHVSVVLGEAQSAARLLVQSFDFYFYTGGEAAGKKVAAAAARYLKPCALELGGKCPVVIDHAMDMEPVLERVVSMKGMNAGQTCFAPDYVLVPENEKPEWLAAFRKEFELRYRPTKDLARIVNRSHFQRLMKLAAGWPGVDRDDPQRLSFSPRVIDADWSHPSMKEEIFGPILPVIGYGEDEELFATLRAQHAPLAMYLFSNDRDFIRHAMEALPSGGVTINDVAKHAMNHRLPFGGKGPSGFGRYRGKHGFELFTYQRAVTRRTFLPDPFLLTPPYGRKLKWLRRLMG